MHPTLSVPTQLAQPPVRLEIGLEIREIHIIVPAHQQRVAQRAEDTRLVTAKVELPIKCYAPSQSNPGL